MTKRERVIAAVTHQEPDRVPWVIGLTEAARMQLTEYFGRDDLRDGHAFSEWVGNHTRSVGPQGMRSLHVLEEEVRPGLWRDSFGVIWDARGLCGEGSWGRPVNCVLPEPTLRGYAFPEPPGFDAFTHYSVMVKSTLDISN